MKKKSNWETGYKVVEPIDGLGLTSAVKSVSKFGCGIIYKVDKQVEPIKGCGPLAVFATLEAAEDFINFIDVDGVNWVVYKCRYLKSEKHSLWDLHGNVSLGSKWPGGTVLADKVILRRRVKKNV